LQSQHRLKPNQPRRIAMSNGLPFLRALAAGKSRWMRLWLLACAAAMLGAGANAAQYTTLHRFADDTRWIAPSRPVDSLVASIHDPAVLLGVTESGGRDLHGTVYATNLAGEVRVLHSFSLEEGASPNGPLVQGPDGSLYGTLGWGGPYWAGSVYRLRPNGALAVIHHFTGTDGRSPSAGLVLARDGALYGTAVSGGPGEAGTVFRVSRSGAFKVIHRFGDVPGGGASPYGRLMQAADGSLFGTTKSTFADHSGCGTIFRIDPDGRYSLVLQLPDGHYGVCTPYAGLTEGQDGWLYGTSYGGGEYGGGTVYRISAAGVVEIVHSFRRNSAHDGHSPATPVLFGANGALYGTTYRGGVRNREGAGTVYRITPDGSFTILHAFSCREDGGCSPSAGLFEVEPGQFVGTALASDGEGNGPGATFLIDDR
jgi:uncharacterized repeat protein (TIGR03803 family)